MALVWLAVMCMCTGLIIGFIVGKRSERRRNACEAAVWSMLIEAGRADNPVSVTTMWSETGASIGWLYPYLARLERANRVSIVREANPKDDRPARYLYKAVIADSNEK